jgi:hypothetical protein
MKNLIALLQVKKLIALGMTAVFCYLAIIGKFTGEQFLTVFTVIISFYYSQSAVRSAVKETIEQSLNK